MCIGLLHQFLLCVLLVNFFLSDKSRFLPLPIELECCLLPNSLVPELSPLAPTLSLRIIVGITFGSIPSYNFKLVHDL